MPLAVHSDRGSRQEADRQRQRRCRQLRNLRIHSLEQEVEFLRAQVNIISAERDELRKVLGRVSSALGDRMPRESLDQKEAERGPGRDLEKEGQSPTSQTSPPSSSPPSSSTILAEPPWMTIPPNTAPVTPLDTLIVEFQAIGARLRAQGLESPDFGSGAFPNVAPILATVELPSNPHLTNPSSFPSSSSSSSLSSRTPLSVSSIIVGHISVAHSHMRSLVSRLAAVWSVITTVRWRMCFSPESFELLPIFFRPTPLQLRVPHPPWVDTVPWPAARDSIIRARLDAAQDTRFRYMLIECTTILWTRPVAECVCRGEKRPGNGGGDGGEEGKWVLSRDFQAHLRDLKNWCLPQEAVQEFPFLQGAVNIVVKEGQR